MRQISNLTVEKTPSLLVEEPKQDQQAQPKLEEKANGDKLTIDPKTGKLVSRKTLKTARNFSPEEIIKRLRRINPNVKPGSRKKRRVP